MFSVPSLGVLANDKVKVFPLSTQTTLNPNVRTMFTSVPIRQFAFQFTMIAT